MRVLVVNHITLDGVLQGPGRPDEDRRDGFRHGGWAADRAGDPAIGAALSARMGSGFSWLFGRRSYEGMLSHWNEAGGPFKDGLNTTHKYVATTAADPDLPWPNSTALTGDVPAAVAELRAQDGGNLVVMGSGELVRSLLPHGLIDELLLMIHPIVLGSGRRLFGAAGDPSAFSLAETTATSTGVIVASYRA
jgi:dihydrofolate reductase